MSARSYNDGSASGQQYGSASSQYRNNNNDGPHAGFGSSTPLNLGDGGGGTNEPQNIMHDRRVIRGSTYSLRRSIENRLNDIDNQSNKSSKRNVGAKRRVKSKRNERSKGSIKTPRPVSGRLHMEIQTDPYLEEIHVTKKEQ